LQSNEYKGKGGFGVVPANCKAPSIGKPVIPRGNGTVVAKVKK
jgi:hypothetical protein